MNKLLKRVLVAVLAAMLLCAAALPAAMAAQQVQLVSNAGGGASIYAGMTSTLQVSREGEPQKASLYRWKSSNTSVVSVNKKGAITGKKAGTATITATRKSDGSACVIKVTVKRNKVDKLNPKPSPSQVDYKGVGILLKSVEIVSPSKVVAEYYVVCNFPSSWKAYKVKSAEDAINLFNKSTGSLEKTIVGDDYQVFAKSISGFKTRKGQSVQVVKAVYSGSRVRCANVRLSKYVIRSSSNAKMVVLYKK